MSALTVTLYNNTSDKLKVGKSLAEVAQLTNVYWKEDTDILFPTLTFHKFKDENNQQVWKNFNYLKVDWPGATTRYYFVDDLILKKGGIIEAICSIDVRETYKDNILSGYFLVARQENVNNKLIPDTRIKVSNARQLISKKVGDVGVTGGTIVLTVSG